MQYSPHIFDAVPIHYTYLAFVAIPEIVRSEFTVQEIKILKLCPPQTLPCRDPNDPEIKKSPMREPRDCVVCGIIFQRPILETEHTYERSTCGSFRCTRALLEWLTEATPITKGARDAEDELLTFLDTPFYDVLRNKWLARNKIELSS